MTTAFPAEGDASSENALPQRESTNMRLKLSGQMAAKPNPIDVHVGKRVRLRRTLLGMSQEKLGEAIGLTFQQVQKYERGTNRIGSSRLYQLSQVLDIPVSYFFDDLPPDISGRRAPGLTESAAPSFDGDPMVKRETLELVRAYYRIQDPSVRKRVFELVKAIGNPAALAPNVPSAG